MLPPNYMKGKRYMTQEQRVRVLGFIAVSAFLCIGMAAQAGDSAAIQQQLNAQFRLTTTTADRTDIVTAGDVVTIHKRNLVMFAGTAVPAGNNYMAGNNHAAHEKERKGGIWQGVGTIRLET